MSNTRTPIPWYVQAVIGAFAGVILTVFYIGGTNWAIDDFLSIFWISFFPGAIGALVATKVTRKWSAGSVPREVFASILGGVFGLLIEWAIIRTFYILLMR